MTLSLEVELNFSIQNKGNIIQQSCSFCPMWLIYPTQMKGSKLNQSQKQDNWAIVLRKK